jgi:hypothetical protein
MEDADDLKRTILFGDNKDDGRMMPRELGKKTVYVFLYPPTLRVIKYDLLLRMLEVSLAILQRFVSPYHQADVR